MGAIVMGTTNRSARLATSLIFPAVAALCCFLSASAWATTIIVTSTSDSGAGSLRASLASATDGDTIDASSVTGTILLTSGELLVTNSVDIIGPGPANLAVDGNAASSVFHINNGVTVSISGLSITNGNGSASRGGGILNDFSTLTVSTCCIRGNCADEGGGIYNNSYQSQAMLTIVASTLSGNSASWGGGIYNSSYEGNATVTVIDSTLSGNAADYDGGGIRNDGLAGSATLTVIDSTFSGNSAASGGGGIHNHTCYSDIAMLEVIACTFSGNSASQGGGILNDGSRSCPNFHSTPNDGPSTGATLKIGHSILTAGTTGENIANVAGNITSDGFNLSSDSGGGFLTATGDQINTDPKLGPLQDNGGPTFTQALLPGSPAIDAGDPDFTWPPDFDQRGPGFSRVVNGRIDIGAFEFTPDLTSPPLTELVTIFALRSAWHCSVRITKCRAERI